MPFKRISGVPLIVAAMAVTTVVDVLARIAALDIGVEQLVFWRSLVSIALLGPVIIASGGRLVRTNRLRVHLTRAAVASVSLYLMFFALTTITLAEVNAYLLTEAPFLLPLAAVILSERVDRFRVLAIVLSSAGVLTMVLPDLIHVQEFRVLGAAAAIGSAATGAIIAVMTRKMAADESRTSFLFYTALISAAVFSIPTYSAFALPSFTDFVFVIGVAALVIPGQLLIIEAFRRTEATVLAPVFASAIPFGAMAGWWWFHQPLTWSIVMGSLLIVGSLVLAGRSEERANASAQGSA